MPHCLVEGCHFRNRKENSCRHFSFPDCEKTRKEWLERLNRKDFKVTKNSRLCIRHFAPEAFLKPEEKISTKKKWLKPQAIPTLEMKMEHHCYKCTYQCWEESTMKLHVSEKHKEIESSEIENLECKTCEVSFGAKDAFVDHMKRFHAVPGNLNNFSQNVLKESFDSTGANNDYIHEKDDYNLQDPFKDTINSDIKVVTITSNELSEQVHEEKKLIICSLCCMTFSTSGSLNRHIQTVHEGIKPFHCSKCDKTFAQRSNIIRHYEATHKEKPKSVKTKPSVHEKSVDESIDEFDMQDSFNDTIDSDISGTVPGNLNIFSENVFKESFNTPGDNNDYSHAKEAKLHKMDPSGDKIENSNDKVLIDEGKTEVRNLDKTDQLCAKCKTCEVSFGAKDAFVDHMKRFHAVELELY